LAGPSIFDLHRHRQIRAPAVRPVRLLVAPHHREHRLTYRVAGKPAVLTILSAATTTEGNDD
jgi:hypothetical protein